MKTYYYVQDLPVPPPGSSAIVLVFGASRGELLDLRVWRNSAVAGDPQSEALDPKQKPGRSIYIAEFDGVAAGVSSSLRIEIDYVGDPPAIGGIYYDAEALRDPAMPKEVAPDAIAALSRSARDELLLRFFDGDSNKGEPHVEPSDSFARRRTIVLERALGVFTKPGLRRARQDLFFMEFDEQTNPLRCDFASCAPQIRAGVALLSARNQVRARYASEGLAARVLVDRLDWLTVEGGESVLEALRPVLLNALRSDLLVRQPLRPGQPGKPIPLGGLGPCDELELVESIRSAFEQFAIGALHVLEHRADPVRTPSRDAELVSLGAPNGSAYLLFAEAASYYASVSGREADFAKAADDKDRLDLASRENAFWRSMLAIFVDTAEVVTWLYWSGAARTTEDYAWNFYRRQRIDASIWERRRDANVNIPGRTWDCEAWNLEEWLSDVTLTALRDNAYATSSVLASPIEPEKLRISQSRSGRPPGTGGYIPTAPPRLCNPENPS